MTTFVQRMERQFTGSLPSILVDTGDYEGLSITRSRSGEIWSSLKYLTDVESVRNNFLRSQGITSQAQIRKVGSAFRAYILQAQNFYGYAEGSDYRSSALLYYYCFLNLGKAKLVLSNPSLLSKEFHHGITPHIKSGDLHLLSSKVRNSGRHINVFNELYNLKFGRYFPINKPVTLENLLCYSTDIGKELVQNTGRQSRITSAKYTICVNTDTQKCWPKLAVRNWGIHQQYKTAFKKFTDEFYPVQMHPLTAKLQFEINARSKAWYTIFEPATEFDLIGGGANTWACDDLLKHVFQNHYQSEIYKPLEHGFEIISPLRANLNLPMDEMLAIYMAMHHLSEVVRYRPAQMEELLSSSTKSGWLMKGFIEQAPLTCVHRFSSWITGKTTFYEPR